MYITFSFQWKWVLSTLHHGTMGHWRFYLLFFSLDRLVTKNQILNTKLRELNKNLINTQYPQYWNLKYAPESKSKEARLSSSLFKLWWQHKTLAEFNVYQFWFLVTGRTNEKSIIFIYLLFLSRLSSLPVVTMPVP